MRVHSFPLAAVLALLFAFPSHGAEKPRPTQGTPNQPKKVWTNEDMGQLRARGLISIVGQEVSGESPQAPAAPAAAPQAETGFRVFTSRLDDPVWYAQQVIDLQAELDKRVADLQRQLDAIALAKDRVTQRGVAMDQESVGVTPAAAVAILQGRVQEIQDQLDDLAELARQHDIPPGDLRG